VEDGHGGDRQMQQCRHETLRSWVRRDRIDRGDGQPGELTSDQLEELRRLRREVAELRTEREILRKAAAFCQGDGQVSRFRFISDHRAVFGVQRLCRVLKVARSG
jgi:hypothetical protein